jgi:predicted phage tail protein
MKMEMQQMIERMLASQEHMKEIIEANQAKTDVKLNEMSEEILSIQPELEETIQHRMEDLPSCVDQKTQGLCKELTEKNDEKQVDLQTVKMSLDMRTKFLVESLVDMRKGLHEQLGLMFQVEAQTTKALIEANRPKFHSQLEEVEARAERGSRPAACTSAPQPPTYDGTTSWVMVRRQFQITAKHNHWLQEKKLMYLITALKGWATDMLHGVPTNVTYEETLQALEDHFGDEHFAAAYRSQLKTRTQRAGESLQDFVYAVVQ